MRCFAVVLMLDGLIRGLANAVAYFRYSTARLVLSFGKFGRSGLYAICGNAVLWNGFLPRAVLTPLSEVACIETLGIPDRTQISFQYPARASSRAAHPCWK